MGHSHGKIWTDELIIQEILKVKEALGLDRMPTFKEIISLQGNGLACKISRTGGYIKWAEELSLNVKPSETSVGNKCELYIKDIIHTYGYNVEKMSTGHPYDLLVNDYIKIDVKISNLYIGDNSSFYQFGLGKPNHNCDIFICVCVNNNIIKKIFIIPSKFIMNIRQLSIGQNKSKYDKYINKYEYIKQYDDFYKSLN